MPPSISVIIPTYNRAGHLAESIDSILAQRFHDFEIVVADDGSTDDTARVLEGYGEALRVIRLAHGGVAAARNAAVAVARGEYVAFHDSDDLAHPDRLAVQHAFLDARPELGAVLSNGRLGDAGTPWIGPALARRLASGRVTLADTFEHSLAQMQAMLFRRAAVDDVGGFDQSLVRLSDLDFVLRFALRWPIAFLDVSVFTYLQRDDSLTVDRLRVREQSLLVLERLEARHPELRERLGERVLRRKQAHRYYSLAKHHRRRGDTRAAQRAAERAVELAPLHPEYRLLRWRLGREASREG